MSQATCRSCGAAIVWAKSEYGKNMPLDATPTDDGNLFIREDGVVVPSRFYPSLKPTYTTHFQTCPNAAAHRRRK